LIVYAQWVATLEASYQLVWVLSLHRQIGRFANRFGVRLRTFFFLFLLGVTALTLWTKRPLVEALPAASMSSSGLLLVALPLSFAVRLHGHGLEGRGFCSLRSQSLGQATPLHILSGGRLENIRLLLR